ncbi:protein of unknown function [Methylocaldum szegediense]|uniref:Uncharacterized protein n=1 Tax=Methylocaldum szegediense TaxID=73780 RepID=A0ABM9I2X6_9GAMM|nr:protein of unknown function [Methylocaldum szegediense]
MLICSGPFFKQGLRIGIDEFSVVPSPPQAYGAGEFVDARVSSNPLTEKRELYVSCLTESSPKVTSQL